MDVAIENSSEKIKVLNNIDNGHLFITSCNFFSFTNVEIGHSENILSILYYQAKVFFENESLFDLLRQIMYLKPSI